MLRLIGSVTGLALLMVACGGGGGASGGGSGATPTPSNLQYAGSSTGSATEWLEVGTPFGPESPTVTGDVTGYSTSPALPAGLTLDTTTGVISGTPLRASPATTYVVTASNQGGSTAFGLTLAVLVPPGALSYASPANSTVGAAVAGLTPAFSGDADNFSVQPSLPAGLTLEPTTGVISGTPTSARIPATYTITASNLGGASTTFDLQLAVAPPPAGTIATGSFRNPTVVGLGFASGAQSGVTDASGAYTYETGRAITFFVGNLAVGTVPVAKAVLTPLDLVPNGTAASNHVVNVVRFLLMLDQDGDPNNGTQISLAVAQAAGNWSPVDFNTTDLPGALSAISLQAGAADGGLHVLPDAATAQTMLRASYACANSGVYEGTYTSSAAPASHGPFEIQILPDGSMHATAGATSSLTGFDVVSTSALNPLLDATFALGSQNPSVAIQGAISDPTFLSGNYLADGPGTFEAAHQDAGAGAGVYQFTGSAALHIGIDTYSGGFAALTMDSTNHVTGHVGPQTIDGQVVGSSLTGTVHDPHHAPYAFLSGTLTGTPSGYSLTGSYSTYGRGVTFSTIGCRAN